MPGKSLKECHSSQPGRQCKIDFCVFSANHRCVWYASYVSSSMCGDVGLVVTKHDIFVLSFFGPSWLYMTGQLERGWERKGRWHAAGDHSSDWKHGSSEDTAAERGARCPPTELLWNMRIISRWVSGDRSRSTKTQSLPAPDQTIKRGIITTWNCKSNLKKHKVTKWRNVKVSTYPWSAEIYAVNIYSGS